MNSLKRRVIASTVLWGAALFVALTGMTSSELTAGEKMVSPVAGEDFAYFPGQYVNQATGPSDPIQGF